MIFSTRLAALTLPRTSLLARLIAATTHQRQRRDLRALDAHMLRDIGLTRAEADAEANRPFWDAPATWRGK